MRFLIFKSIFLVALFGANGSANGDGPVTLDEPATRVGRTRRLVGGRNTSASYFPYYVSLEHDNQTICGGAIVSANFVLTAAYCVVDEFPRLLVRAGSYRKRTGGSLHRVGSYRAPDNFTAVPRDGIDIALIRLADPLQFGNEVQPIEMLGAGEDVELGSLTDITGFGNTGDDRLWYITAPVERCVQRHGRVTPPDTFCAGFFMSNICFEDAGSPVTVGLRLAGIVSYAADCQSNPGVITKVSIYRDWITSVVKAYKN